MRAPHRSAAAVKNGRGVIVGAGHAGRPPGTLTLLPAPDERFLPSSPPHHFFGGPIHLQRRAVSFVFPVFLSLFSPRLRPLENLFLFSFQPVLLLLFVREEDSAERAFPCSRFALHVPPASA